MILLIAVIAVVGFLYRSRRASEQSLHATYYYCDMGNLFLELRDDPSMDSAKWREWLPLFEDAERMFTETHPYVGEFFRYSEAIKKEIIDPPFLSAGSS